MEPGNIIILLLNLALGFGFAAPLARRARHVHETPHSFFILYVALVGVYLVEKLAFAAGMATNLFTIASRSYGASASAWYREIPDRIPNIAASVSDRQDSVNLTVPNGGWRTARRNLYSFILGT